MLLDNSNIEVHTEILSVRHLHLFSLDHPQGIWHHCQNAKTKGRAPQTRSKMAKLRKGLSA